MFLQEFGDHANIIKLHNVLKAENDKDIYLVFEFMGKWHMQAMFLKRVTINQNHCHMEWPAVKVLRNI